jgi:hypothetical protein
MQLSRVYSTFSIGKPARREDFGLPSNWGRVRSWLTFRGEIKVKKSRMTDQKKSKWDDIPHLSDYGTSPEPKFWENFPQCDLPKCAETNINVSMLEKKVAEHKDKMTIHQYERSLKAIDYLCREGFLFLPCNN